MSTETSELTAPAPDSGSSRNRERAEWLQENRVRVTVLAVLLFVFIVALLGLERDDWFSTIMQGLSVGALTFLVVSGLSLIFGLMDVFNLAHGEFFMLGAVLAWACSILVGGGPLMAFVVALAAGLGVWLLPGDPDVGAQPAAPVEPEPESQAEAGLRDTSPVSAFLLTRSSDL